MTSCYESTVSMSDLVLEYPIFPTTFVFLVESYVKSLRADNNDGILVIFFNLPFWQLVLVYISCSAIRGLISLIKWCSTRPKPVRVRQEQIAQRIAMGTISVKPKTPMVEIPDTGASRDITDATPNTARLRQSQWV